NRLKATIIYVTHDQVEAMTLGTRIVVLKDGVIMQVDSPQKLYNEPNNLFVAGFIGSPQMNFIDTVCKVEGEKVTLSFEGADIVLPPAKAKKLVEGGYDGKTVVMGIRPENIDDSQMSLEAHKDATFEVDVNGYELLGSEVLLYCDVAGNAVTAKVDPRTTARMGDHIKLAMNPERIHVFDKETEQTITN
ncbi:MAG: ABC transporter ATP-binding protein, partial [Roseburia sp.]|nr:ABC transporter ATP-binding protein [Roseburia sp.]